MSDPDLERRKALRARVEAYERRACAASLREVPLAQKTPAEVHEALTKRGFTCRKLGIPAHRTRTGEPQWRTLKDVAPRPDVADAVHEYAYEHQDGGIVRMYPARGPKPFDEIARGPVVRKSVRMPKTRSLAPRDEACAVDEDDNAIPRSLRMQDGLKFDQGELLLSFRLAGRVFGQQLIPLKPGDAPSVALSPGSGFVLGSTLIIPGDFKQFSDDVRAAAQKMGAVVERVTAGDLDLFFTGSQAVLRQPRIDDRWYALTALTLHGGSFVGGIQPFGYEASAEQLRIFLVDLFGYFGGIKVLDNVTGEDITRVAERFPEHLLAPEGPPLPSAS